MKIAVFCASSTTVPDSAKQLGFALGAEIAAKGHELVWGGGADFGNGRSCARR